MLNCFKKSRFRDFFVDAIIVFFYSYCNGELFAMIERKDYLKELLKWKDEKVIKVITGLRRCGKSTLLNLFQEHLIKNGVKKSQIVAINFEVLEFEHLKDYKKLHEFILSKLSKNRKTYVFLDEIQLVNEYQKAIDSLYIKENVDIYITGSNAYLLSGELATLLSGRYVELNILPFSFKEYCEAKKIGKNASEENLIEYMRFGSLPYIVTMNNVSEKADTYLEGIYNTIIMKDIELRQMRKEMNSNQRKVTDMLLLRRLSVYLANSIGSPVSIKSLADYITSSGRKVSQSTIDDYVEALIEPYVFYPVYRYDIVGKRLLKQNRKIYITDLGLRRYLLSKEKYDLGFSLENIVFLELKRRGYAVNIGKVGKTEVDFVVWKGVDISYYQVTASMLDENTFNREISPLKAIKDNYPKTILTLDRLTLGDYAGIKVVNIVDWLLEK